MKKKISFSASGQFYRGSARRVQFPVKNSYHDFKARSRDRKIGSGPHIFYLVNDRVEKRSRMCGRALNRWKLKMAEEILNFTTKSGTSSQHITEIFDLSRDV